MSLNENLPADASSTLADLNELLRETRAAVNASISAISALGGVITSDTDLDISTGTTYIIVGKDISDQAVEVINLTAEGACSLAEIRSGRAGQVKIIKFGDSNVTIVNSLSNIVLNRTGNLSSTSGVILALFNVGGDVDSNIDGVWYELGCSKVLVDDGTMVTAFAKTLLDDANITTFLATLGITVTSSNINSQITSLVNSGVSSSDLSLLHKQLLGVAVFLSWFSDLDEALTSIGSSSKCLIVDCNAALTQNTIIPKNVSLEFIGGSIATGGYTLNISGNLRSDRYQIFSGFSTGDIVFEEGSISKVFPEWFGAINDDSTNCTTAIQSAIDGALVNGIALSFNTGVYRFNSITLPDEDGYHNYVLEGAGCPGLLTECNPNVDMIGGTVLKCVLTNGTNAIIVPQTANTKQPTLTIRNLALIGPDTGATTTSGHGFYVVSSTWTVPVNFENVAVAYFKGSGKAGFYLYNCENSGSRNMTACYNDIGVLITSATNACTWNQVVAQYNSSCGVKLIDVTTHTFSGGLIQNNFKTGMYINGCDEISIIGIHFESNNSTSTAGEYGLHIEGTTNHYNSRVNIIGCRFAASGDAIALEGVSGGSTSHVTFIGNRFQVDSTSCTIGSNVLYTKFVTDLGGTIVDGGYHTELPYTTSWTPSYSCSGSMTIGSVSTLARYIISRSIITVELSFSGTTGGSASTAIYATLPSGITAARTAYLPAVLYDDAGTVVGYMKHTSGSNTLEFYKTSGNWAISAGEGASINFSIEIE